MLFAYESKVSKDEDGFRDRRDQDPGQPTVSDPDHWYHDAEQGALFPFQLLQSIIAGSDDHERYLAE